MLTHCLLLWNSKDYLLLYTITVKTVTHWSINLKLYRLHVLYKLTGKSEPGWRWVWVLYSLSTTQFDYMKGCAHWTMTLRLNWLLLYSKRLQVRCWHIVYYSETLHSTLYSTPWQVRRWPIGLWLWNCIDYPLLYTMTGKAEPGLLWYWDSTDYSLLYLIICKAAYVGLWHWDTTDYHLLYTISGKTVTHCLWLWNSTDYPLLYTITGKTVTHWSMILKL